MRIDVIDDARRADQVMTLAFHAKRVVVKEGGTFCAPAFRAVERPSYRITPLGIVLVALTLLAPANRTMDRWADGQGADLDDADDDGVGNDNARDGGDPSRALLSRA